MSVAPGDRWVGPGDHPLVAQVRDAIATAKRGDPLAPVTVLAPSGISATTLRRGMLWSLAHAPRTPSTTRTPRRGLANVRFHSPWTLVSELASAALRQEGLRPASHLVVAAERLRALPDDVRARVLDAGRSGALQALERACSELELLEDPVLERLARRGDPAGVAAQAVLRARTALRHRGLADAGVQWQVAFDAARTDGRARLGSVVVVTASALDGPPARLAKALLQGPGAARVELPRPAGVRLMSCATPEHEARRAVASVVEALERGVPLWAQAIGFAPDPRYRRMLAEELRRGELPFVDEAAGTLAGTRLGRLLLSALDLAASNLPRRGVIDWLGRLPACEANPELVLAFDRSSRRAGVVGGIDQWRRLGSGAGPGGPLVPTFLHTAASAQIAIPSSGPDARLARWMLELVERLAELGAGAVHATWSDSAERLEALLNAMVEPPTLMAALPTTRGASPGSAGQGPHATSDTALHAELEALHAACRHLHALDGLLAPPTASSLASFLRHELGRASSPSQQGIGNGVLLAPATDLGGVVLGHLALVGLAEGFVPAVPFDPMLGPDARRQEGLPTVDERIRAAQTGLCASVASSLGTPLATWPTSDPRDGRRLEPSRFLEHLGETEPADEAPRGAPRGARRAAPSGRAELRPTAADGPVPSDRGLVAATDRDLELLERWAEHLPLLECPLAQADEQLLQALTAATSRLDHRFGPFDGLVEPEAATAAGLTLSRAPTALEEWADCPRRYLLGRVLGLQELEEPEELLEAPATSIGTLVHRILERYGKERVEDDKPRSLEALERIANEELDRYEAEHPHGPAAWWAVERRRIELELERFFEEEGDDEELLAVELRLPSGRDRDAYRPVRVGEVEVPANARIDRVGLLDGSVLVVTDYKTGRGKELDDLRDDVTRWGTKLQLFVYAQLARQWYETARPERRAEALEVRGRYWLVSRSRHQPAYHVNLDAADVKERFQEVIAATDAGIREGVFVAAPAPGKRDPHGGFERCRWCPFDRICPPVAERVRAWSDKGGAAALGRAFEVLLDDLEEHLEDPKPVNNRSGWARPGAPADILGRDEAEATDTSPRQRSEAGRTRGHGTLGTKREARPR
jgi:ATP-dependent helicase/nuclease subunit B